MVGEDGFTRLVTVFYGKVRTDDILGPLYPQDDWEGAEQRLRDFLIYRFGGSHKYIEERGHPRLRMRHLPFKIGVKERDRWVKLMGEALSEAAITGDVAREMGKFFSQTADFMRNQHD